MASEIFGYGENPGWARGPDSRNCPAPTEPCRSRTDLFRRVYLRAAQAYMLISMPTGTSTIFGVFQLMRVSQVVWRDVRAGTETRVSPERAQVRKRQGRTNRRPTDRRTSLLDNASSLLDQIPRHERAPDARHARPVRNPIRASAALVTLTVGVGTGGLGAFICALPCSCALNILITGDRPSARRFRVAAQISMLFNRTPEVSGDPSWDHFAEL
jgi:hypothetical protein